MRKDSGDTEIMARLRADGHVQRMKGFVQHGRISTYEHCENVARISYRIGRALPFRFDTDALLAGAMLHDFYLYDWHHRGDGSHRLHGLRHAERAARNAEQYLQVDGRVRDIICSHMWPLNLTRIPPSREAWIVCIADKVAALQETVFGR